MEYQIHAVAGKIGRSASSPVAGVKNLISRATSESLRPRWLWFEVTDRCNSRCKHCNIWRNRPIKDPLTPEEIKRTLSDPLFRGVRYILNSGGEPVLRNDLEEIIVIEHEALPEAGIQLSTNGLLPDRVVHIVKTAIKHDITFDVGVSLDGIGEDHDRVRGVKGNFEKADRLLHELVALRERHGDKLGISAGITLSDLTLHSVEEVREYAQRLNIDLMEAWYNEAPYYDNIGQDPTSGGLIKAVESQPNSPLQERWLEALRGKSIRFPCFAMYTFCVLKCNGDIVPCLSLWDTRAGNVRESSPTAIWHNTEMKQARRIVKNCQGCLNSWGAGWSFASSYYPILSFYIRHPRIAMEALRRK